MMPRFKCKQWFSVDLSSMEYTKALVLQHRLVAARNKEIMDKDIVLSLQHFPVFTLGRRAGIDNLNVSEAFLAQQKIAVIRSERGGDITFHTPGQLIVYPVIDLEKSGLKVVDYVTRLEEIMIRVVENWGIKAERNSKNRGIWVGNSKLGSIGIAVRRGIAFHGFALNVNPALEPFEWINPCGMKDCGITSMARELSKNLSVNPVREAVKRHLEAVFGVMLVSTRLSELQELIKDSETELTCKQTGHPG